MKEATKTELKTATQKLFKGNRPKIPSDFIEVIVNVCSQTFMGKTSYKHQRKLFCLKNTSIEALKINILQKLNGMEKNEKKLTYHIFYQNKLMSTGNNECIGDLIKNKLGMEDEKNKIQITLIGMEAFG